MKHGVFMAGNKTSKVCGEKNSIPRHKDTQMKAYDITKPLN